jgi:hypothetical protein
MMKFNSILAAVWLVAPFVQASAATHSDPHLVPRAYWGEWRQELSQCGSDVPEDNPFNVSADGIGYYESAGTATKVIPRKGGGIIIHLKLSEISGSEWPTVVVLKLLKSGKLMWELDEKGKRINLWRHCLASMMR